MNSHPQHRTGPSTPKRNLNTRYPINTFLLVTIRKVSRYKLHFQIFAFPSKQFDYRDVKKRYIQVRSHRQAHEPFRRFLIVTWYSLPFAWESSHFDEPWKTFQPRNSPAKDSCVFFKLHLLMGFSAQKTQKTN